MPLISIIICSTSKILPQEMLQNISDTIGVDYELVIIDNSCNYYSIFSAYNEGVKRSNGDYLCFVHNDVIFHTINWGRVIIELLQEETIGLVGIAGTHIMPRTISSWWDCELISENILQGFYDGLNYTTKLLNEEKFRQPQTELAAIDGVFMCMPRRIYKFVRWDETNYNGFHAYDLDMSMQVISSGFSVRMCWDILIEHKSNGNCNDAYNKAITTFYNKWKERLPVIKGVDLSESEISARTRIAYLKHNPWEQYTSLRKTKEYKLGNAILHPTIVIGRRIKNLFK